MNCWVASGRRAIEYWMLDQARLNGAMTATGSAEPSVYPTV